MNNLDWNNINNLAVASLSGDRDSYRHFLAKIKSYISMIIMQKVPETSRDDVIQEVLLAIHKSLKTLDPKKCCRPWVNAITHYKISDYLRKHYADMGNNHEIEDLRSIDFDRTEFNQYIEHITSILDERERALLIRLKYEGDSIANVAKEYKLSESNVKKITSRTIKKLREFIKSEEFHE